MRKPKQQMLFAAAFLFGITAPLAKAQDGDNKPPVSSSEPAKSPVPVKDIKADEPSRTDYTVGEQDILDIVVWREKELSAEVVVRPDGKIGIPLVGEIYVIGMTPTQLQDTLTEKLKPFVNAPRVTVTVKEINSRKVYLIGRVGHEGVFRINSSTTVSQIIAEAGGLQQFAKRKKIYILRNVNGKQVKLPVNYDDVIKNQGNSQDLILNPGDKIVVP
jgi:polysaccharide export outer membrane protein